MSITGKKVLGAVKDIKMVVTVVGTQNLRS